MEEEEKHSQIYFQHCKQLLDSLTLLLRDETMLDVTLICKDGEQISTSSILLYSVSPMLRNAASNDDAEITYINLPDLPLDYLTCFLTKLVQWRAMPSKSDLYMMHTVLETLCSPQQYSLPQNMEYKIFDNIESLTHQQQPTIVTNTENISDVLNSSKPRRQNNFKTIYRCDKCMKQFRHKRDFVNHLNSHFGIKPYSCHLCCKNFTQKSHLNTHLSIHSGTKKYICYKCGRAFNVASNLKKHLAVHFRDKNEPEYQGEIEIKQHHSSSNKIGKSQLDSEYTRCPESKKEENNCMNSDLVNDTVVQSEESEEYILMTQDEPSWRKEISLGAEHHQQIGNNITASHNNTNSVFHVVSEDERVSEQQLVDDNDYYPQPSNLAKSDSVNNQQHLSVKESKHQDLIHIIPITKLAESSDVSIYNPEHGYRVVSFDHDLESSLGGQKEENNFALEISQDTQPFKCTFCVKAFKQKSHLNHHIRVKHLKGEHLEKFSCKLCDKKLTCTNSLKNHMRLHENDRPHKCLECDKSFVQASHLKLHMSQHYGEKPFSCALCSKSFVSKSRLNEHTKIHNGERRFYECEKCSAKYVGLNDLKVHLRRHTGEQPFQCKHCNKKFRSHRNRDTHERIHTGEKPYLCCGCGKGFSSASALHQHYTKAVQCKAVKEMVHPRVITSKV